MADFSAFYPIIAKNEGGFVNDANDRGGFTYAGITRKNFPNWKGWESIDAHHMNTGDTLPELAPLVKNFYKVNFWDAFNGDAFDSQDVANFVCDWFVNSGKRALFELQRAVGMEDDGIIGDHTIHAVNNHDPEEVMKTLKTQRIKFYNDIVAKDATQKKFLKGWISRVESFA